MHGFESLFHVFYVFLSLYLFCEATELIIRDTHCLCFNINLGEMSVTDQVLLRLMPIQQEWVNKDIE